MTLLSSSNTRTVVSPSAEFGAQPAFTRSTLAVAVVAALSPGMSAYAQGPDENLALEEVIVTATKRSLNLQDVPQSINAFSGEELHRMGVKNMNDYVKALPSVTINQTTPGRNQLVMRGISTGSNEYRNDSQVAVYLDELAMTTNSQQVSPRTIDMERLESLPGPQGTLFGSSSQTGTLRLITNKPNFDGFSAAVEGGYGTIEGGDESYDFNGFANFTLIDDVLAVRAVAYTSKDGGYVDNVLGSSLKGNYDNADEVDDDFNEFKTDGGRLSVLWNISDDWSVLFNAVGENTNADGSWETDPELGDYKITRFVDESRDDDWWTVGLTLNGDLGFADLTLSASHFDRDIAYEWDNMAYSHYKDRWYGGGLWTELYNAGDPAYYYAYNFGLYDGEYTRSTVVNDQQQDRDTIELRLASSGDSRLQWMIGGYYESVHDEWYYYTKLPALGSTRAWSTAQAYAYYYSNYYDNVQYPLDETDVGYSNTLDRTIDQTAVFGEASYDLTDELTVIAGTRWAKFDRDEFNKYQFPEGLSAIGGYATDGEYKSKGDDDDVTYKLSAQYQIDDDRMVYALFSQGFRLGGVNSQRAGDTGLVPYSYDPDFLDNYELGIKSQWFDNSLQVNASLFYMKWEDYQINQGNIGAWWVRGSVNAGDAETTGLELTTTWQASSNLKLSGRLFVADAEFSEDATLPNGDVLEDGMPMPGSPDAKGYASLEYTVPDILGGDLWFSYDISYSSESWASIDDIIDKEKEAEADEWWYSNFSMGFELPSNLTFTVRVDNVWDQQTYTYVSTYDNGSADLFGDSRFHNMRTLDQPRTAWLTVRKRF
jgi:iron complex outermembrane receptor protein